MLYVFIIEEKRKSLYAVTYKKLGKQFNNFFTIKIICASYTTLN